MNTYTKIYTGTPILVNRLAYLLNEINIPYLIKDHGESARLAGFGTIESSTELFVSDDHREKAIEIMNEFEKEILK